MVNDNEQKANHVASAFELAKLERTEGSSVARPFETVKNGRTIRPKTKMTVVKRRRNSGLVQSDFTTINKRNQETKGLTSSLNNDSLCTST